MESNETLNLLFCVNRKFLPLLLSCLRSIVDRGGYDQIAAYVLHSDFAPHQVEALARDFGEHVTFHFLSLPEETFEGFPESGRYPREIYYRLAAPLVLPQDLERILYLDVDTVILNPLRELYEMDFEGNYYIGCTHTRGFLTRLNQARLKSPRAVAYINTGVLLMNLPALRENLDMAAIRDYTTQQGKAFLLPDQDILTALYGDRVKLADPMRYNLSDRMLAFYNAEHPHERRDTHWVRSNAVVIHYCGKNKPWNDNYVGTLGVFYRELFAGVDTSATGDAPRPASV